MTVLPPICNCDGIKTIDTPCPIHGFDNFIKETAACHTCEAFMCITYVHRDVPLNDDSGVIKDVLVGICDVCGSVCSLPSTSTPKVQAALRGK